MRTLETGYDLALVGNVLLTLGNVVFGQFQVTPQHRPIHVLTMSRPLPRKTTTCVLSIITRSLAPPM